MFLNFQYCFSHVLMSSAQIAEEWNNDKNDEIKAISKSQKSSEKKLWKNNKRIGNEIDNDSVIS